MDLPTAPEIVQALVKRAQSGQFGYAAPPEEATQLTVDRMLRLYGWKIQPEWIVWLPGTVPALRIATMAFCDQDDAVLTFTPAYTPFLEIPPSFNRQLITVPLNEKNDWNIDFKALERAITPRAKLLLLCNPHNPTGKMFKTQEIARLIELCTQHNIVLCSDEVHAELILDESKKHTPAIMCSDQASGCSVTVMSASKAFNLAGLSCGFAIIPNEKLRHSFMQHKQLSAPAINTFGYTGTIAAFAHGDNWKQKLLVHLRSNVRAISDFCDNQGLEFTTPDATYLAWIDVRPLNSALVKEHSMRHGSAIHSGEDFGYPGFIRVNFACSKDQLAKGLASIGKAISTVKNLNSKRK